MIISEPSQEINSPRIPNGDSDVLLGCDLVVSASKKLGKFFLRILLCCEFKKTNDWRFC